MEDNETLRVPLYVPYPAQLSPQCLHEESPNLPAWGAIAPQWHEPEVTPPHLPRRIFDNAAVEVCARVGVDPVSVDLPYTEVLLGWSVPWLIPLLPFPIRRFCRLAATFLSLRANGCCLRRGCRFVSARSVLFSLSFRTRPGLPYLYAPAPTLSFPRPRLFCVSYLSRPLLFLSGLGHDVGTLTQTLAGHADASGLAALASHGLACRCGPAFSAGVDGRTIRSL